MRILILGGTQFVGRWMAQAAIDAGHQVTLFNRGQSNPHLFAQAEKLTGDRGADLSALQGRTWDAVIDTSAYFPRQAAASADLLKDSIGLYLFVSSIAVYADFKQSGLHEGSEVGRLDDENIEVVNLKTYGPLKALCEREVNRVLPDRNVILRPCIMVGPHDNTDRFTWWLHRAAQGGEMFAPGGPEVPFQIIDARDLAAWAVRLLENGQTGTFNAAGLQSPVTLGDTLTAAREISGSDARFTWVSEDFFKTHKVSHWRELPFWLPTWDAAYPGYFQIDNRKAVAAGLTFRPLRETVAGTLAWSRTLPADHAWRAGLTPQREEELLQAWRDFQAGA
ncbi:MAG: NAD-dependent epimerase/dehydratase family protein [Chloroflexi bacterium]|nr:NAD-dependent epimerase/dehydratase family protein [Chloroflexota bacterium]